MLPVQLEGAVDAVCWLPLSLGGQTDLGEEMRIALSPQLLALSWGSHRPGVALLSLLLQKSSEPSPHC